MITFMESKEKANQGGEEDNNNKKLLDSQLWHACAGGMVKMPLVNSRVFYFPQGHAEHSSPAAVNFHNCPRIPPYILCRVQAVKFLADPETDEVYAKVSLVPVLASDNQLVAFDEDEASIEGMSENKPASFAKTLTQSDANNGGGFSVPRYCAETIFPRLDYSADPPVQNILAKDVHGEMWKFRHIYRGTPRRHLLTTGWSTFVNHKKLVAGDSIVFLRADNGDLCVGIRRAKRGIGGGVDASPGWSSQADFGFSSFLRDGDGTLMRNGGNGGNVVGKVKAEAVVEAASLAASGRPFEVVYYPRASTPEFCVKASSVKAAMQIRWCPGMRFKMAFETEDSSRISWFMGTISSVQVADPIRWPDSPWRLLQVTWDEPELLQNVKRVSPWLVELVSNMPAIHLSPFSPPRKKPRLPPDFPLDGQFPPIPGFSSNYLFGSGSPFGCLPDNNNNKTPAGMQGARHAHFGLSLSDLHFRQLQSGNVLIPPTRASVNSPAVNQKPSMSENNVSCLLTMAYNASQNATKNEDGKTKPPQFVLFGQPILTEQQISLSCSSETVSMVGTGKNSSSNGNLDKKANYLHRQETTDSNLETGQCKVFMDSENVGRTFDLSLLESYDELHKKLADMFRLENPRTLNHVVYRDLNGTVKKVGDEPFSEFVKAASRLTILTDFKQQ